MAVGYLLGFKAWNNTAVIFHTISAPSSQPYLFNLDLLEHATYAFDYNVLFSSVIVKLY